MYAKEGKWLSDKGFTVLETLLTVVLFSFVILGVMELFMAITLRMKEASLVQRYSRGPQYVVSLFSSSLPRATRCALYPDRSVFLKDPALGGVTGNFAVLWFHDGTSLAFEFSKSELRIVENPGPHQLKSRVFATGVDVPEDLCTFEQGLAVIHFIAKIGATQTHFRFCARLGSGL